ncbi:MAG: hypothetical protein ACOC4C_01070 [Fibrobacterota bacterium]
MKKCILLSILTATIGFFSGCVFYEYPTGSTGTDGWGSDSWESESDSWESESDSWESDDYPHIDSYLSIPYEVKTILEPYVQGYFTPDMHRYPSALYPVDMPDDPDNLPCHVRSDFNGDYIDDFSFLFTSEVYDGGYWYTTTKLLVVLSDRDGYFLAADIILGEIESSCYEPEEFWAIGLMPSGTHTISTEYNDITVNETITLDDDGFFLISADPLEESIYFAHGCDLYVMEWSNGTYLAKGRADQKPVLMRKKVPAPAERQNG